MLAYVFPGQGAQRKGMGADQFDTCAEFFKYEREIDHILGYSLREMCIKNPGNMLSKTQYSQPCLYTVNALRCYSKLAEGSQPSAFAGHSLGEYNALHSAGVFDFLTGLRLVKKRGELMALADGGGMAAVVGLNIDTIKAVLVRERLAGIDFANFNSPMQTVISGPTSEIDKVIPAMEAAGAEMCIPLWVSAAFHSRYMAGAAEQFGAYIDEFEFSSPDLPVMANVTGQPYPNLGGKNAIHSLLIRQISEPVQWMQCIRHLLSHGYNDVEEIGDSMVLTPMIQQIRDSVMPSEYQPA